MRSESHIEQELDLVVDRKEVIAAGVVRVILHDPAGGDLPAWEPGAHIDLGLGDNLVRQYSLCGDRQDPSAYQVAVLREPDGRGGSAYVHDVLARGQHVSVRGPRNNFPLIDSDRYLFIAGGIGVTPFIPMVASAESRGADWRLVYGGRSRASMAFSDETAAAYPGKVDICPEDECGLLELRALLADPTPGLAVYCCGPGPLLNAVEERCSSWPAGVLRVERFMPKAPTADEPWRAFEVELAQSGRTLRVPPDRSILDVLEDAGVYVLSSCRDGTCGTCETAVLDGVPDHRDSVLTESEQGANDAMMICVSRARSARLVLDR
jgi:ferredoxin-NADP reductase